MKYVLSIIIGYLLGSISSSFIIGKLNGIDIRKTGTGNAGASNTVISVGWAAGVGVALFDILKAVAAVMITRYFIMDDQLAMVLAGCSAVIGHIFPFYMQFKGGKGFACYFGLVLALNWKLAIILVIISVIITLVTDFIALATITTCIIVPAYFAFSGYETASVAVLLLTSAIMIYKHKINIQRILTHQEIGLRRVNKQPKAADNKVQ